MADDYSDLDLSNPTPIDPYNQGAVNDFLYNNLVPEYLKSDFYKTRYNPNYNPDDPNNRKIGYKPGASDFAAHALPDILSWLAPEAKALGAASKAIIAGPKALTANMGRYHDAMDMLFRGKPKEYIHDLTGWFPRQGGKELGFEIPDTSLIPKKLPGIEKGTTIEGPYSEFVTHQNAIEAYPELAKAKVVVDPSKEAGTGSSWRDLNAVVLGGQAGEEGLTPEQLEILAHETQHLVQGKEGWPSTAGADAHARQFAKLVTNSVPRDTFEGRMFNDKVTDLLRGIRDFRKSGAEPTSLTQIRPSFAMYWNNPTEVEPRNVQNRFMHDVYGRTSGYGANPNILPSDRSLYRHPWSTEDVPRAQQFDYWKFLKDLK